MGGRQAEGEQEQHVAAGGGQERRQAGDHAGIIHRLVVFASRRRRLTGINATGGQGWQIVGCEPGA
jgi:hypothetical protein